MANLAAAVANHGGWVLYQVEAGFTGDYNQNKRRANLKALVEQIQTARRLSLVGAVVNIMVAINDFATVQAAIEAGIDIIFPAPGCRSNFRLGPGSATKLVPIILRGRANM